MIASVAQLDYPQCQRDMDAGTLHPSIALLPEIGELRQRLGRERHAISLDLPDSEIVRAPDGHWTLELRAVLPVEQYNAEISLLTGMCAAAIMLDGGDRAAADAAGADRGPGRGAAQSHCGAGHPVAAPVRRPAT